MPSALETLIKIVRLEQQNGYTNRAVHGGLEAYAPNWAKDAHNEAKRPEQHALVEEILLAVHEYQQTENLDKRRDLAQYVLDRITRRVEARPEYVVDSTPYETQESPPPVKQEEVKPAEEKPLAARKSKPRFRKRPPVDHETALEHLQVLEQSLMVLSGIGEKMAEKMAHLGPTTIRDLLYVFPRRYDDYTKLLPLNHLKPKENVTIIGTVRRMSERKMPGNRTVLVFIVEDGTAAIEVSFFGQEWLKRQLKPGMQLVFSGQTGQFQGRITLTNPEWEPIDQKSLHTGGLVPVYPLTKGISARTMRRIMKKVVEEYADLVPEVLPAGVRERTEQVDLNWAIRQMHFPENLDFLAFARERLAFDELLSLQLSVMGNRRIWHSQPGQPLAISEEWLNTVKNELPFQLTGAQDSAISTILSDMARNVPMNRLLQGDVGSGKTIVAAIALAAAVLNGKQAAMMTPTSILAEQHYHKLADLLTQFPGLEHTQSALLTSDISEGERRSIYEGLASGQIHVVFGTHAIIQAGVEFQDLAAAVIDEQHRFGVEQRGTLRGKGTNPHLLVMSATPIPRTLALTAYADLDLTVLDEMPPGRTPIQTRVITPSQRTKAYLFIEENVLMPGQQAYVIYPLVEASESLEAGSVVEGFEELQKIFYKFKVGLMHGRLRPAEKEAVMQAFIRNEIQVLVSTTVVEVGVDVPNATAILIENAERFGLAQLHQLRGRVGRGSVKS
ncbi:MAG: ATP-dependent DNA helicase RecG, partial [Anaerolineae bacterium]|nr:ATP-dependent DNA helicase RecG [Anaerolineae bacterium]